MSSTPQLRCLKPGSPGLVLLTWKYTAGKGTRKPQQPWPLTKIPFRAHIVRFEVPVAFHEAKTSKMKVNSCLTASSPGAGG